MVIKDGPPAPRHQSGQMLITNSSFYIQRAFKNVLFLGQRGAIKQLLKCKSTKLLRSAKHIWVKPCKAF